tara:strand:- start:722 stop:1063 length:342 start_codon:yes stop_codon:yes gene_type:complete
MRNRHDYQSDLAYEAAKCQFTVTLDLMEDALKEKPEAFSEEKRKNWFQIIRTGRLMTQEVEYQMMQRAAIMKEFRENRMELFNLKKQIEDQLEEQVNMKRQIADYKKAFEGTL